MHAHRQLTIDKANAAGIQKINDQQVDSSQTLREVAIDFVATYKGTSGFVQSLAMQLADRSTLSIAQMRGALNVMLADARQQQAAAIKALENANPLAYALPAADKSLAAPLARKVPNGTYTVVLDTGERRTIKLADAPEKFNRPAASQIASLLTGSDNEHDYTGFAFVDGATATLWVRFRGDSILSFALTCLLHKDALAYGQAYALESGRCFICNRKLTTPESIAAGIGPVCAEKTGIDMGTATVIANARPASTPESRASAEKLMIDAANDLFGEPVEA